jgi:hypothetical protein
VCAPVVQFCLKNVRTVLPQPKRNHRL